MKFVLSIPLQDESWKIDLYKIDIELDQSAWQKNNWNGKLMLN